MNAFLLVLTLVSLTAAEYAPEHSRFRRIEKIKVKVGEPAFLENFQTFVADQSILVPSNLPGGNHKFKFDARNDHAKTLVVDDAAGPINGTPFVTSLFLSHSSKIIHFSLEQVICFKPVQTLKIKLLFLRMRIITTCLQHF